MSEFFPSEPGSGLMPEKDQLPNDLVTGVHSEHDIAVEQALKTSFERITTAYESPPPHLQIGIRDLEMEEIERFIHDPLYELIRERMRQQDTDSKEVEDQGV
ncbi:hypothetical protein H0X09_03610 [Candidatus Saccharibacteria bacterium]|nr:hypothetical protein [Candidatus Saccharibacteria bacterium]